MKKRFPEYPDNKMRYFVGDVRDGDRIRLALSDVDFVIHAAALKQVPSCEYNPFEAVRTNIIGTENVIKACNQTSVTRCMLVSTDKAVNPINLYGATKLCAEKLMVSANVLARGCFSVCRYGNVEGSRGSVLGIWKEQFQNRQPLTITDDRMTRFFITQDQAAEFVISRLKDMKGGEIFLPKLSSYKMTDRLWDIYKGEKFTVKKTGIRPGEKLHESLINEDEVGRCYDNRTHYTIYPAFHDWEKTVSVKGEKVKDGFTYTSEVKDEVCSGQPTV
jgi:UDP-N-acetylglucosamine 4,6-dehydratase